MENDLRYLAVNLPEDLRKLKGYGDFDRMRRVIAQRLAGDLPEALRKRLELELIIIDLIPPAYPFTKSEALARAQAAIEGFTEEELDALRDADAADWAFVNGEVRFRANFIHNLFTTRPQIAARAKDPKVMAEKRRDHALLDETIAQMKAEGGLAYRIRLRMALSIDADAARVGEPITVHLPLPREADQVRNVKILHVDPKPSFIAPPDFPQRTLCFKENLREGQVFTVEFEYETHMKYHDLDPAKVSPEQPSFDLEEQPPHIVFTPYLRMLAEEIVGDETNPLEKARKIYDFITTKVIYSFVRNYWTMTNLPEYMATGLKGDCGIFSLLFITLCRMVGVPARWQSGLFVAPGDVGNHDWAQFYIAPYGWLFADGSFGCAAHHWGSETRRRFYFGNLDPFRMPAAGAFQHAFDPPKKHPRHDPYDNQLGEVEYADHGLYKGEFDTEITLLSLDKLN